MKTIRNLAFGLFVTSVIWASQVGVLAFSMQDFESELAQYCVSWDVSYSGPSVAIQCHCAINDPVCEAYASAQFCESFDAACVDYCEANYCGTDVPQCSGQSLNNYAECLCDMVSC